MRTVLVCALVAVVSCSDGGQDSRVVSVDPHAHLAPSAHPSGSLPRRFPGDADALRAAKAAISHPVRVSDSPQTLASMTPTANTCGTQIGVSEAAIGSSESFCNCLPPDGALAVGPSQVVVAVNTAMKVYDQAGTLVMGPVNLSTFLAQPGDLLPNFSDPFVLYDASAARFVVGMINYDTNETTSTINVAVSQTSDPTGAWYVYSISIQATGDLFDFPHAAIDGSVLYVSGNLFQGPTTYLHARVFALNLAQMYAGTAPTTVFKDVGNNAAGNLADTLIPAANDGASNTMYFLSADNQSTGGGNISLFRWSDPFGANAFALQGGVAVTAYQLPPDGFVNGSQVDMGDARILAAYYYNGTLYGAHTGGFSLEGFSTAAVQWVQLGSLDGAPTLLQQGILGSGTAYRFYPALAVDSAGDMMIAYAYAGPLSTSMSVFYSARRASDAAGRLLPESSIVLGDGADRSDRWGDYGTMVWDPGTSAFWHLMEYDTSTDSWATWLSQVSFNSTPGFDIGVSPSIQSILDGTQGSYTVTADVCNGYSGTISLSQSGLDPATIPTTFSPAQLAGGGTSTLTLSPTSEATLGGFFTVTGTDTVTQSSVSNVETSVHIEQPCPSPNEPTPLMLQIGQNDSGSYSDTLSGIYGWNGTATFGVQGLPAGATFVATPASGGLSSSWTTQVTTSNTPTGYYYIDITASDTSTGCTSGYQAQLQVSPPTLALQCTNSDQVIKQGNRTASFNIQVQAEYGFSGTATMSASSLPPSSTSSFNPASMTLSNNSTTNTTFSVNITRNTPKGIYMINVFATSGSVQGSTQCMLQVN